jgi:hypothetical protein
MPSVHFCRGCFEGKWHSSFVILLYTNLILLCFTSLLRENIQLCFCKSSLSLFLPPSQRGFVFNLLRKNSHTITFSLFRCAIQCFCSIYRPVPLSPFSNSRMFSTPYGNPVPISSDLPPLCPWKETGRANLLSVSAELPILHIPYKPNHWRWCLSLSITFSGSFTL